MSTTYNILRFAKPTKKDLKNITHFSLYDRYEVGENDEYTSNEFIRLFRTDDPYTENLLKSRFAVHLTLPYTEKCYEKMYRAMGFDEEAVNSKKIHLSYSNGWHYFYSDGEEKRKINTDEMKNFEYEVTTGCIAVKMEMLWDGRELHFSPDHDLVRKYIPDLDKYYFAPVSNSILAKAEIPFLIFEKNKGKCFIEEI